MNAEASSAITALEARFLRDFPREAARRIEILPIAEVTEALKVQPASVTIPVFEQLAEDVQEALLEELPDEPLKALMSGMDPPLAAELLHALEGDQRARCLKLMEPAARKMVEGLMGYAPDTAGRLMDPRVVSFRGGMTVAETLARMKGFKKTRALRELYLVDDDGKLTGRVDIQEIATAAHDEILTRLARPVPAAVLDLADKEEVVERIEQHRASALPVVNVSGRLLGVIHASALFAALQEEVTLDIQTMVGAHKDERALSSTGFAVRKRLPWLQINLATAFLAAAVVGLFEDTIAKFTALAVLLPVVAGQSGNAGAQALAVTMRGLALREISIRQLPRVVFKEIGVGFLNGVAVAATTALGVYFWSGSAGLCIVISASMVIAMVAAGFSGAVIPIALSRLGLDPAQASSIVLTTVTDVVGFFSFLGIATALHMLL
ncbi:MAG: magnesium transporter [Betaproteobacteria bacterium]|nr:magnesium transporter [Betaproteobacteria bacterium]